MVEIVYQDLSNKDFKNYYVGIPRDWKYGKDGEVTVVVSDVCVVIPQTIAGAPSHLTETDIASDDVPCNVTSSPRKYSITDLPPL